jgi:mannitol-1-phosphate 5-dehydrogenase
MQRAVMIGAGATGRGHIGLMLYQHGWHVSFVDKKRELIESLLSSGGYNVRLLGKTKQTIRVVNCDYYHTSETDKIAKAVGRADLVCTSVFDQNLPDVAVFLLPALKARRSGGNHEPLHVICCENMMESSQTLRKHVYALTDKDMSDWLDAYVSFPNSMISRIVPQPEQQSIDLIAEDYNEWTVDAGTMRSDLELPVLHSVSNQTAYLERKLFIHNGGHAVCGYMGFHFGHRYIHEAVADKRVASVVIQALDELGAVILHKHPFFGKAVIDKYKADLAVRGAVVEIRDEILRVVRDPIRKLSSRERLVAPALYALHNGLEFKWLARGIASVFRYKNPADSQSVELAALLKTEGCRIVLDKICGIEVGSSLADEIVAIYDSFPEFIKSL